jgi:hypothetical protein
MKRRGRGRRKKQLGYLIGWIAAAALLAAAAFVYFGTDFLRTAAPSPAASETPLRTIAQTTPDASITPPGATATAAPTQRVRSLYEAAVTIFPDVRAPRVEGAMRLTYVNTSGDMLYEVKLHLHPNDVSSGCMSVSDVAVNDEIAYYVLEGERGSILNVSLSREIAPGERAELYLNFYIVLPETGNRFGVNSTGLMLGNMLPIAAVYENGAWRVDEYTPEGDAFYSACADYKVAVSAPSAWELAYTGSLVEKTSERGINTWYITAMESRDFAMALMNGPNIETVQTASGHTTVYAFGTNKSHAEFEAEAAAEALSYFDEAIGDYPYDTFFVVPFDTGGGMEYPGLIMICEQYLHVDDLADAALVIGHETAHQWFYAVVGSDQINAPWLDESLVEYLGFDFLRSYAGEEKMREKCASRYASHADYTRTMPIDSSLYDFSGSDYFHVVYGCGYEMYDALHAELGRDVFYEALKTYFNANSFAIADKDDLIAAFTQAAGRDMTQWFEKALASAS